MPDHILALDQGTTSSRAIVFDRRGLPVASAQREFTQIFPEPGLVEHDPEEIWESQLSVAREALERAGIPASGLAALGITNQRETTLLWDRETGEALGNAIVWQDRRTASFCRELEEAGHAERIRRLTGLVIDPYFSGSKIRWMLDHLPRARELADAGRLAFGTVDSWLVWKLTGGRRHLTDATNASRTLLCDIDRVAWSEELLDLLGVPASVLPEIVDSSGICAETLPELLGAPVPVAGLAGDQHAALFGQACIRRGMAKNTYGTGCFVLLNTGAKRIESKSRLLTTVAWQIDGAAEYALEGSIFVAGAVVQWLRDQLGAIKSSAEVEALASEVEDNGGVYFVPAFTGLGAPWWDSEARGTVCGLTRGSGKAHLARAALESIAFQTLDVLEAMQEDSGIALSELRVDGGASANALLMQIQADLLGVPVVRPRVAETTALGAACLAGLAAGVWKDREEIAANWIEERRFEPGPASPAMRAKKPEWRKAVERARL